MIEIATQEQQTTGSSSSTHTLDYSKDSLERQRIVLQGIGETEIGEGALNIDPESDISDQHPDTNTPIRGHLYLSGRDSPVILRDEQTQLPDNLPPMARLRYCSPVGGSLYGHFVTKERCYV